jgi:hypothetical protein
VIFFLREFATIAFHVAIQPYSLQTTEDLKLLEETVRLLLSMARKEQLHMQSETLEDLHRYLCALSELSAQSGIEFKSHNR